MNIQFFTEDIQFNLQHKKEHQSWLQTVIKKENYQLTELNYIFCSDKYLHKINLNYLNHDSFTDVISFDQSDVKGFVEGDIFISVERVEENAKDLGVTKKDELDRVMVHGLLHFLGYKDKSEREVKLMRDKEDTYLSLRSFN